jgi:hypothetical protein
MRLTINLPDDLYRRVEAHAALEGRNLLDLIIEYLEHGLERGPAPDLREVRRHTPLPGIPATGVPIPALTNEELARIEEEEDLDRFRRSLGREPLAGVDE